MDLVAEAIKVFGDEPARKDYRVGIILIAPSGRCLALLRSPDKKLGGGTWGVPGGKVEMGETLAQAAIREAGEETGAQVLSTILLHAEKVGDIEFRTFIGFVSEEFEPILDHEHTAHEWVRPDQWPQPAFSGMDSILKTQRTFKTLECGYQHGLTLR